MQSYGTMNSIIKQKTYTLTQGLNPRRSGIASFCFFFYLHYFKCIIMACPTTGANKNNQLAPSIWKLTSCLLKEANQLRICNWRIMTHEMDPPIKTILTLLNSYPYRVYRVSRLRVCSGLFQSHWSYKTGIRKFLTTRPLDCKTGTSGDDLLKSWASQDDRTFDNVNGIADW